LPGTELGKALKSSIHPLREDIPIFLGAEGPKNIALAAELCDGWLALFFSPTHEGFYRDALNEGFAREGARRNAEDFEVAASVPFIPTDDIEAGVDMMRPMYALYFGGMGAKSKNFHADVAVRMGFEGEVAQIKELYLSGKKDEAAAAVPEELVKAMSLIGSRSYVAERLQAFADAGVTTINVTPLAGTAAERVSLVGQVKELAADL
jgi:F420-dependent oxidoreductase-like protein